MRLSSRTAQAKTPKYWFERIFNRKFETSYFPIPSVLKIRIKNPKVILCLLNPLFPISFFFFYLFLYNVYYLFS
ncbi:hypothetical protein L2E82_52704 [Cichorium intybus]|nr:hypothetical protein L2E82_52704 [Cichorium intybus]